MRQLLRNSVGLAMAAVLWAASAFADNPWDTYPSVPPKVSERLHKGPYHHPHGLYFLMPDRQSRISESGPRADTVIRSKRNYILNIQTNDASPGVPLPAMIVRLEREFLGPGKPWERKLRESDAAVAGLPARGATYEGPGARIKVLIVRGARTDFVIMFLAMPHIFDSLLPALDDILATFQPAPEEMAAGPGKRPGPAVGVGPATQSFRDETLGYKLDFPRDWAVSRPTSYSVALGGREGARDEAVGITIQNVRPPAAATPAEAAEAVYGGLKQQLEQPALSTIYLGEGAWVYDKAGVRIEGLQFLVEYLNQGQRHRQTTIVLPRPDGPVAHILSYQAPQKEFQTYWPMAEAAFKSWILLNGKGAKP
ncbi:MAG: hypothetical protein H7841_01290 [Magnetospirillum sp. WYHS-4]